MVNNMGLYDMYYYIGLFAGLTIWMFYLYWVKHEGNPAILFDKKYLVPFFASLLIAAFQIALDLMGAPVMTEFVDPWTAFMAGFTIYVAIQELIKGALKYPRINYFNK